MKGSPRAACGGRDGRSVCPRGWVSISFQTLPRNSEPHRPRLCACSLSLVLLLRARPPRPTEGTAVTLTCEARPPLQQAYVQLQFRFFRDDRALQPGWSRSPELQVPAVWSEDSRSYWCEAQAADSMVRRSRPVQLQVQSEHRRGRGRGPGAGPGGSPLPLLLPSSGAVWRGTPAAACRSMGDFSLLALPVGAIGTFRKRPLCVFTVLQSGTALTTQWAPRRRG